MFSFLRHYFASFVLFVTISLLWRPQDQLNCCMVPYAYAGNLVKRGGHMLHLEHSLTSYIAILDYKFDLGQAKNNNAIKKVTH